MKSLEESLRVRCLVGRYLHLHPSKNTIISPSMAALHTVIMCAMLSLSLGSSIDSNCVYGCDDSPARGSRRRFPKVRITRLYFVVTVVAHAPGIVAYHRRTSYTVAPTIRLLWNMLGLHRQLVHATVHTESRLMKTSTGSLSDSPRPLRGPRDTSRAL